MTRPVSSLNVPRLEGLLLDTNLLLLLIVGDVDTRLIKANKRTARFEVSDYELVNGIVERFDRLATTPNILTEVSNLADSVKGPHREEVFARLAGVATVFAEEYVDSRTVASQPSFATFGLADLSILMVAKGRYLVLTTDHRLADHLGREGVDVLTLDAIRALS